MRRNGILAKIPIGQTTGEGVYGIGLQSKNWMATGFSLDIVWL